MVTSSSLRMGMERTCRRILVRIVPDHAGVPYLFPLLKTLTGQTRIWNMEIWKRCLVCTYSVLLAELLGQTGAHNAAALAGGGLEVRLAGLAPRRGEGCKKPSVWDWRNSSWRKRGEKVRTLVANSHLDGASLRCRVWAQVHGLSLVGEK
jgi:hypothetical protein